jgi:hypothetical protein
MNAHAKRYFVHGVTIASAIPLTDHAVPARPEIVVRSGRVQPLPGDGPVRTRVGAETSSIAIDGIGRFAIRRGREIVVDAAGGADEPAVRDCLLGPALALALMQRGRLVLHATAVVVDGHAVAFVGASGAGKSTTAAAFHAQGCRLLADDFLAIAMDGAESLVHAGPARFKFRADAAVHFGGHASMNEDLAWSGPKRMLVLREPAPSDPLPLARIYVLEAGERTGAEPLSGQAALLALLPHAGPLPRLRQAETGPYLQSCARLASRVPVVRLHRPIVLEALPQVAATVRADLERARLQPCASP